MARAMQETLAIPAASETMAAQVIPATQEIPVSLAPVAIVAHQATPATQAIPAQTVPAAPAATQETLARLVILATPARMVSGEMAALAATVAPAIPAPLATRAEAVVVAAVAVAGQMLVKTLMYRATPARLVTRVRQAALAAMVDQHQRTRSMRHS